MASIIVYSNINVFDVLYKFLNFSTVPLVSYILAVVFIQSLLVYRWKLILRAEDQRVSFITLFMYKTVAYSVNFIMPTAHIGGEASRAYMLKRNNVPLPVGVSSVLIDKSVDVVSNVLFAAVGLLLVFITIAIPSNMMVLMVVIIIITLFLIIRFYRRLAHGHLFISKWVRRLHIHKTKMFQKYEEDFEHTEKVTLEFFANHRKVLYQAVFISVLLWFFMFIEYKSALSLVGIDASLTTVFLVLFGVGFAYLVPVPAALGILELSQLSIMAIIGIQSSVAVALSLLVRAKDLIRTFVGMAFLSYVGITWRMIRKND